LQRWKLKKNGLRKFMVKQPVAQKEKAAQCI